VGPYEPRKGLVSREAPASLPLPAARGAPERPQDGLWLPPDSLRVVAAAHPFKQEHLTVELQAGKTVAEILTEIGIPSWSTGHV
jgi:hypothetical protein